MPIRANPRPDQEEPVGLSIPNKLPQNVGYDEKDHFWLVYDQCIVHMALPQTLLIL